MKTTKPEFVARAWPYDQYQYVTVEFPLEHTDVRIPHDLVLVDPDQVDYLICGLSREGILYDTRHDPGGTTWALNSLVLRATTRGLRARLLLVARPVGQ